MQSAITKQRVIYVSGEWFLMFECKVVPLKHGELVAHWRRVISHKTSIFRNTAVGTSYFVQNHSIILNFNSVNWLLSPSDYPFINFGQHSFCTGPTVLFTFKTIVYTYIHTYIQEMFNSISQQSLMVSVRYTIQYASFSTYYGCKHFLYIPCGKYKCFLFSVTGDGSWVWGTTAKVRFKDKSEQDIWG